MSKPETIKETYMRMKLAPVDRLDEASTPLSAKNVKAGLRVKQMAHPEYTITTIAYGSSRKPTDLQGILRTLEDARSETSRNQTKSKKEDHNQ